MFDPKFVVGSHSLLRPGHVLTQSMPECCWLVINFRGEPLGVACFHQEHRDLEVYEAVVGPVRCVDTLQLHCPRDGQLHEMDMTPALGQRAVRRDELLALGRIWHRHCSTWLAV